MFRFFGKKKKDSPTDSAEEASTSSQANDYIIIERQGNPFDPNEQIGEGRGAPYSGGSSLYPSLDNNIRPPPLPSSSSSSSLSLSLYDQQNILGDTQTYLNLIQFQLCEQFINDTEIDQIHINEKLSYFSRVKNEDFNYDFSVEKSVITEMDASTELIN